ncbi:DUF3127 domain-containing protein [Chryseobacterium joostei]|uniref:DUF3127 domain-containing protein n=1 Tax=Chryseobacterium joostei TaxID=112234 RepID=A0A1N7IAZ1_9FLAO|nr:DUF3127 domain-containing protein [Chryseobacterium joostei]AZB01258.1 DUF3127 domain-containing protein [Chryseobacterium joostei]SIS34235.1 protein of unknown function [Chryseobacterium joostei]
MELIGTIKNIGPVQNFASGFQKREFILVTEEQYPQTLLIEITADRIDLLDHFKPSDIVRVGINIKGKEWTSPGGDVKYFTSLSAWKVTHKILSNSAT